MTGFGPRTGLLLSFALATLPSLAATRISTVGGWEIETVESAGRITSCRATRREGELRFSFVESEGGSGVNLSTEKWKLDRGTTYRLSLAAPPAPPASGLARASAANELDMPVSAEFLGSLNGKTALDIRPVALSYRLSLAGAPEALKALKDCWAARSAKPAGPPPAQAAGTPAPQQPAGPPPAKPVTLPGALSAAAVTAFARDIFGPDAEVQAGSTGSYNILSGETVTVVRALEAPGAFDEVLLAISRSVAGNCKGTASQQVAAADVSGPVKLGRFQVSCDTGDGPTHFDTTAVSDGRRAEVYSVLSPDPNLAVRMGTRIYDTLHKVFY